MKAAFDKYADEVYRAFKMCPVWPPEARIALGDVGRFERDGTFTKVTSLKQLKVDFEYCYDRVGSNWNCRSDGNVSVSSAVQDGSKTVEIQVSFEKKQSILCDLKESRHFAISKGIASLEHQLNKLRDQGKWDSNLVVITEIVQASSFVLFVSNSDSGEVVLKGDARALPVTTIDSCISAHTSIQSEKSMAISILRTGRLTPFFVARKLHLPLTGKFGKISINLSKLALVEDELLPRKQLPIKKARLQSTLWQTIRPTPLNLCVLSKLSA